MLYQLMAQFTIKLAFIDFCTILRVLEFKSDTICVVDLFFHHRLGEPEHANSDGDEGNANDEEGG